MKATDLIFKLLLAAVGFMLTRDIQNATASLDKISASVSELNVNMAVVIERQENLQEEVKDHSQRLRLIETKKQ